MGAIRVLPPDVVNKIAAGEVIERPASVVKELIENALDAGAGRVVVEVEEGGRRLVRVTDDGGGIAAEDLPEAFAPHATSKLACADDLFRIRTFGFRGEALASIGAVARARVVSRPRGAAEGAEITMEGGKPGEVSPAAHPEGTTVEVRNLFFAIPARRKFLRAPEVELEHVEEAIDRFALAHPKVRFELKSDGAVRRTLPPASGVRERVGALFDRELMESLIEARLEDSSVVFTAYLAPPKFARLSLRTQFVFLNGRFIRDRVLTRAVNEAYREMLPHGRFPIAFLFLDVPPSEVDVNVHPTKIEVRFRSVWKIHDLILGALRARLMESELAPRIAPEEAPGGGTPLLPAHREIVEFFAGGPAAPATSAAVAPLVATGRRCFQVHDRYIVEEVEDGLRIIDQHALHERALLEELRRQYRSSEVPRQRLLLPAVLEVSDRDRLRLDQHRELLASLGVEIEEFGPASVAVRAVPALVSDVDPRSLVRDFLEAAREHGESEAKAGRAAPFVEEALEFLACRAAIKFGRRLGAEEIGRLLADARDLEYSATCAHGRPTAIKLTLEDLERFFKRKGA
ncbi:MAG: DNA mismatch repair endonuclease MutL [Planctomycetes bacterium]|nr:DNA mismatch repair endonuclease MutL [Planctomycetota bacterium]